MLIIFDLDDTLFDRTGQVQNKTQWQDVEKITLFPGVQNFLNTFPARKILLTRSSTPGLQEKKIENLKLKPFFEKTIICQSNEEKREHLRAIQQTFTDEEIWVVGDRRDAEIRYGNELGLKTILIKNGHHKNRIPSNEVEKATFEIDHFLEINKVIS